MMEYVFMNQSHVSGIAALEKTCFNDPWSEWSIASELDNPLSLWVVAVDGGIVAGYIGSQSVLDGADMMNIAVDPNYRRQGIAECLIGELEKALEQRGVKSIALEVRLSNVPAISLYEKLGFCIVGKRPGYYRNPKEDAYIMRKELDA